MTKLWLFLSLSAASIIAQTAHPHFNTAARTTKSCATSLSSCPASGCGGGDALLNKKKSNLVEPSSFEVITFDDFRHLESERPTEWKDGQSRKEVEELGEGTAVMLTGYLLGAHSGSPETTNCKLSGEANNDYHINIVEHEDDFQTDSVVVEMTPKSRIEKPEWTLSTLHKLSTPSHRLALVRVSGFLLFDSEHVKVSGGERSTIWEIHPITKVEVCTTANCTGESDEGWQNIRTSSP
jgi:hypothetical protein